MEDVAKPPHLQRRKYAFYYRRAVPAELRPALNRAEFVVSLKTLSFAEAKRRYAELHAEVERQLERARAGLGGPGVQAVTNGLGLQTGVDAFIRMASEARLADLERADGIALASSWPSDLATALDEIEREADHYANPDTEWRHVQVAANQIIQETGFQIERGSAAFWSLCQALNNAQLEHLKRHFVRLCGKRAPFAHRPTGFETVSISQRVTGQASAALSADVVTVAELVARFEADPRRASVRQKTKDSAYAPAKKLLLEVCGADTRAEQVKRSDLQRVRSVLMDLPPRVAQRYRGATLIEAAKLARANGEDRLSPKTIDNQLIWVTAFFNFAEREQLIQSNPARQLTLGSAGTRSQRPAWTVAELNLLFSAPVFAGCVDDERHWNAPGTSRPKRGRYWVPLLALFQGLRMNEACQLFTDDVFSDDGVMVLRVASNASRGQQTKKNDVRLVPLHPTLVALGFASGSPMEATAVPMFPELTRDKHGSATNAFSKWFARLQRELGITRKGVVFHSLRHNFADAMRRADISPERSDALGGWATPSSARRGYGHGLRPADLASDIAKVEYPGLNIDHLEL
ncbi:site-specific integrase [Brevundimonas aurifodinae]|uniref:Site-specific integrase n=2 Tax=Brevundimonas TaxID=41275 RepID=A0ABV1NSF8_9CAUL|nr:MAG: hypothetical protein B7Z42_11665 [Brevundimonas sp. 12-68-7]OYX30792.1 MAG: hypothetical protein B7Z01_13880 [Brevundimonas subvibrioides]